MPSLADLVGTGAALCSMTSFVPQIAKIVRERDASGVSLRMPRCWVLGSKACTTPPAPAISRAISTAWSPK